MKYCEIVEYRAPDEDCYGWARLCQVLCNYFGADGLCVGCDTLEHLHADGDNGTYIIKGWKIVGRKFLYKGFKERREYKLADMLKAINEAQPASLQTLFEENLKRKYDENFKRLPKKEWKSE